VIPEIEMPGHSRCRSAQAYPELGCAPVESARLLPESGNFVFLENVLSRKVIELFRARNIHIGGDEVERKAGAERRSPGHPEAEGLKDEDSCEPYFLRHIERFLTVEASARSLDEILQGRLAPNAIVMSWRGGRAASKRFARSIRPS